MCAHFLTRWNWLSWDARNTSMLTLYIEADTMCAHFLIRWNWVSWTDASKRFRGYIYFLEFFSNSDVVPRMCTQHTPHPYYGRNLLHNGRNPYFYHFLEIFQTLMYIWPSEICTQHTPHPDYEETYSIMGETLISTISLRFFKLWCIFDARKCARSTHYVQIIEETYSIMGETWFLPFPWVFSNSDVYLTLGNVHATHTTSRLLKKPTP